MLNKKIHDAINDQINKELYSGYLYVDIANYFEDLGFSGFAHWFMIQAAEERDHALYFREYLIHRGAKVTLGVIENPNYTAKDVVEPFVAALEHEQFISASINDIYELALKEKDYATVEYLNWFVKEQAEEEASAEYNLAEVSFRKNDVAALKSYEKSMFDREYEKETPEL